MRSEIRISRHLPIPVARSCAPKFAYLTRVPGRTLPIAGLNAPHQIWWPHRSKWAPSDSMKGLFRNENSETLQCSHSSQRPVSGNKTINATSLSATNGGGQMKGIKGTKPILASMAHQQFFRAGEIHIQESLRNEAPGTNAVSAGSKVLVRLVHRHGSGPYPDGGYRSQFHHCQARGENVIVAAREDLVNRRRLRFKVEPFGQGARVEEIQQRSVLSALLNDQFRPGAFVI